ncbi:hypothetical protein IL306_001586 [Fusarium sp. DS 682]|nr:hypothetical protein IL306_001586 [Fusarium sp. DS 682]
MISNRWEDKSRLTQDFCLDDLSKEWESINNSWTKLGNGKHFTSPFLTAFGRLVEVDESSLVPVTSENRKEYQKYFPNDPPQVIQTFLERPGNCPLAIRTASIYLLTKGLSLDEYLRLLDSEETMNMVAYVGEKPAGAKCSYDAVVRAWSLPFHEVAQGKAAFELLSFLSWINPKRIPKSLLPPTSSFGKLVHYGLVDYNDPEGFDIHPLFHYLLRICIQKRDPDAETLSLAMHHVIELFPKIKSQLKSEDQILKHLDSILRHKLSVRKEHTELAYDLAFLIGQGHKIREESDEAIASLETVFDWRSRYLPPEDPKRLECQLELVRVYQDNDNPAMVIHKFNDNKFVNPFRVQRPNLDKFQGGLMHVLQLGLELAKARMKVHKFDGALELLEKLKDAEPSANSYPDFSDYQWAHRLLLIDVYESRQNPKKALEVRKVLIDHLTKYPKLFVLESSFVIDTAKEYGRAGSHAKAIELLEKLREEKEKTSRNGIIPVRERVEILEALRHAYQYAGKDEPEKLRQAIRQAWGELQ